LYFTYRLFGLRVRSNLALPGLEPVLTGPGDAQVRLHFGGFPEATGAIAEPFFTSCIRTGSGEPMQRIWKIAGGAFLRIAYADSTQFWLDAQGRDVWCGWGEHSSFEDAASYLMGPILGYLLRLRGVTCLHASAVRCGEGAAVFIGPGGAGKSTLAAAMALRGHAVVSEDVVALGERNGVFDAAPAYPYLGLWPESVQALYGPEKDFAAFSGNFAKRMVRLSSSGSQFAAEAVALDSLFLLEERSNAAAAPFLESIDKRQALMGLVANTYANLLLDDELRAREFAFLGRLVNAVPVKRLRPHGSLSRIDGLCGLIENEVASRKAPMQVSAGQ
jgi:hypothetical protein